MARKYNITIAQEKFKERGYTLIETEYKNSVTKMRYKCPYHEDKFTSIKLSELLRGKGCPYCVGKGRILFSDVQNEFSKRGYVLLEKEYINTKSPLRFICNNHPNEIQKTTYDILKYRNSGCKYCGYERGKEKQKLDTKIVEEAFSKRGYKLLSKYENSRTPVKYLCKKHPEKQLTIDYESLKDGHGCYYCYTDRLKGSGNHNWKGGVTELTTYLRQKSFDRNKGILKTKDYTCYVSGRRGGKLVIHHVKPFHKIRDEVLLETGIKLHRYIGDYTEESLSTITEKFLKKHDKGLVVVMDEKLHRVFHRIYGHDVTKKELDDFKQNYNNNEIDLDAYN